MKVNSGKGKVSWKRLREEVDKERRARGGQRNWVGQWWKKVE